MKKIILSIIIILTILAGYTLITNNTSQTPEFSQGLQLTNLKFEEVNDKYLVQITLSTQMQKQVKQINVEFYDNTSIVYRNTITEINENPLTYAVSKEKIKTNITSILITSFNNTNEVLGTTYLKV